MARNQARASFDDHTRIVLVEQDNDTIEASMQTIKTMLITFIVTLASASIALALNLAVRLGERAGG